MRINVYSQELTKEVELVQKTSADGKIHYGIRFWLHSAPFLHNTPSDDDRSAVTFWIPTAGSFTSDDLRELFICAASLCPPT